jgi:hypothetical protein
MRTSARAWTICTGFVVPCFFLAASAAVLKTTIANTTKTIFIAATFFAVSGFASRRFSPEASC